MAQLSTLGHFEFMIAFWSRARISVTKVSMGSVLLAALFILLFTILPGGYFVDLRRFEWQWGCPLPIYLFSSGDGDFHGLWWRWYYFLPFDLVFWTAYFFCAAVVAGVVSRKMRGRIRPFYALMAFGCLAGVIYAFVYRHIWHVFIETLYL